MELEVHFLKRVQGTRVGCERQVYERVRQDGTVGYVMTGVCVCVLDIHGCNDVGLGVYVVQLGGEISGNFLWLQDAEACEDVLLRALMPVGRIGFGSGSGYTRILYALTTYTQMAICNSKRYEL